MPDFNNLTCISRKGKSDIFLGYFTVDIDTLSFKKRKKLKVS